MDECPHCRWKSLEADKRRATSDFQSKRTSTGSWLKMMNYWRGHQREIEKELDKEWRPVVAASRVELIEFGHPAAMRMPDPETCSIELLIAAIDCLTSIKPSETPHWARPVGSTVSAEA